MELPAFAILEEGFHLSIVDNKVWYTHKWSLASDSTCDRFEFHFLRLPTIDCGSKCS